MSEATTVTEEVRCDWLEIPGVEVRPLEAGIDRIPVGSTYASVQPYASFHGIEGLIRAITVAVADVGAETVFVGNHESDLVPDFWAIGQRARDWCYAALIPPRPRLTDAELLDLLTGDVEGSYLRCNRCGSPSLGSRFWEHNEDGTWSPRLDPPDDEVQG